MEEIVTNEYIQYKSGFIGGKSEIIDYLNLGKIVNIYEDTEEINSFKSWFEYGYEDGFNYFSNLINNGKYNFDDINIMKVIKDCYIKRVLKHNKEKNGKIVIAKYKI